MTEASTLSPNVQKLLFLPEKYALPLTFSGPVMLGGMLDFSLKEIGEMEIHLKGLPNNPGIEATLQSIEHARLGGVGPFKDALPPLTIPDKLRDIVRLCDFFKPNAFRIEILKKLTPDEAAVFHEALQRARHERCACDHLYSRFNSQNVDALINLVAQYHPSLKFSHAGNAHGNWGERLAGEGSQSKGRLQ